jgi:hypothetical protein
MTTVKNQHTCVTNGKPLWANRKLFEAPIEQSKKQRIQFVSFPQGIEKEHCNPGL